jgi:hypothetical protein
MGFLLQYLGWFPHRCHCAFHWPVFRFAPQELTKSLLLYLIVATILGPRVLAYKSSLHPKIKYGLQSGGKHPADSALSGSLAQ